VFVTTSEAKLTLEGEMLFAFVFMFTSLAFFLIVIQSWKRGITSLAICALKNMRFYPGLSMKPCVCLLNCPVCHILEDKHPNAYE